MFSVCPVYVCNFSYRASRKHWEECSGRRTTYDVNAAARAFDESLLRDAETLYSNLGGVVHAAKSEAQPTVSQRPVSPRRTMSTLPFKGGGGKGGGKGSKGHKGASSAVPQADTEQQAPAAKRQRKGSGSYACYTCGQPGHVAAECPKQRVAKS